MTQKIRNDSLDNFETNMDQDLGKAIAEAASALKNSTGTGITRDQRPALPLSTDVGKVESGRE